VDCVRAALAWLAPDVEMVVSGVNAGANLGVDLLVSGTFAAAREAALEGVSAMAVSHYRRPDVPRTWDHVPRWLEGTLADFSRQCGLGRGDGREATLLWNVNLPAIDPESPPPATVRCAVDTRPLRRTADQAGTRLELKSDFHGRPRQSGSDVERCFAGLITISQLTPHPV
jgi:5'-nucleotidase